MQRVLAFVGGLVAALALFALMAPTGGFPSRPQFRSVGVGTAAPADVGTISGAQSPNDGLILEAAGGGALLSLEPDLALVGLPSGAAFALDRNGADFVIPAVRQRETVGDAAELQVGESIFIAKTADESRATDTTLTIDDDLQVTNLPAGHYALEVFLSSTEGGGGFSWRWAAPDDARTQGTRACGTLSNIRVTTTDANSCTGGNTVYFFYGGGATTDTASTGTLGIEWAQDSSNAVATVLESRSWLKVTRLK